MASASGFPASFYSEPGVLGFLANGISAFLVLLQNFHGARTGIPAFGVENILAGLVIFWVLFIYPLLNFTTIPVVAQTFSSFRTETLSS